MPEPAAWRYQKIIRPMFDIPAPHRILKGGKVLTCVGDEVIENGFVVRFVELILTKYTENIH